MWSNRTPNTLQQAFNPPVESLSGIELSLYERWVPLGLEDMKVLERFSFRRKLEDALTVQWEFVRDSSQWELFFPTESDSYRWWQISKMTPDLELPLLTLVCVESNSHFILEGVKHHSDDSSEFDLLLLNPQELISLREELTRNV